MLLSHKYNFLFVHLAKTGGTSIRAALDVHRARDPWAWPTWIAHRASAITGHRIAAKLPRHAGVIVAQEMLPPDMFASLFKFGFVRNPWARLVSAYNHFQRERAEVLAQSKVVTFDDFARHIMDSDPAQVQRGALVRAIQRPQIDSLVGLQREMLVDFVGRYETLCEDFATIVDRLAIRPVQLPHKRQAVNSYDYRAAYNDVLAERVARHYASDLSAFGYLFDDLDGPPRSAVDVVKPSERPASGPHTLPFSARPIAKARQATGRSG